MSAEATSSTATSSLVACNCTGRCLQLGYCPCNPPAPRPCGHSFPWHGVVPPTYCPICGSYIGPVYCPPACPQPPFFPTITYVSNTTAVQENHYHVS